MSLIYDESAGSGHVVPYHRQNATKGYLRHFGNLLYLEFVETNPRATQREKAQARKEQEIARRKMRYFERHPNYDRDEVLRGVAKLKKEWGRGTGR